MVKKASSGALELWTYGDAHLSGTKIHATGEETGGLMSFAKSWESIRGG